MIAVFGPCVPDWFHPPLDQVGGLCISHLDGKSVTVLMCKPILQYEPTVMQVVEEDGRFAEHKAVYFCPNALIVMRPTEAGDISLIENINKEAVNGT